MILSLVSEILAFIRWETVLLTATVRKPRIVQKHLFWSGYPYRIRRFKGTPTSHKIDDSQKCFSKWIVWRYLWLIRDLWFFHTKKAYSLKGSPRSYLKYAVLFQKYIIENFRSLSKTVSHRYLSSMDMITIFFLILYPYIRRIIQNDFLFRNFWNFIFLRK